MRIGAVFVALACRVGAELTVSTWGNLALEGAPLVNATAPSLSPLSLANPVPGAPFSAEALGTLNLGAAGGLEFVFRCEIDAALDAAFVWVDDHLVCQRGVYELGVDANANKTDGSAPSPLRLMSKPRLVVRVRAWGGARVGADRPATVALAWSRDGGAFEPLDAALLAPEIAPAERTRDALARSLARGWGLWNHNSLLDAVLLPEGSRVTAQLCRRSNGTCLTEAIIDDSSDGAVRPDVLAYDRSYARFYVAWGGANASVTLSGGDERLLVAVELEQCVAANCSDFVVRFVGSACWAPTRAADVAVDGAALRVAAPGLRSVDLFLDERAAAASGGGGAAGADYLEAPLALGAPVGLSSGGALPYADIADALAALREAELATYAPYGALAGVKRAMQAGVMWNLIWTPAEIGPLAPVSRGWDFTPAKNSSDFGYVIFDWDNFFASYMLSLDAKELAYSNLIQVTRSKTGRGFVPNYSAGGIKSQDRTEPPIGAKVLLETYRRWREPWLVELLLDDLLDWSDWFYRERVLAPWGLVALGSDEVHYQDYSEHAMQGARFESGLDNSPMYDGEFFDNATSLMQLADVGMSSMVVQEAEALAELAAVVNRTADAARVLQRANATRAALAALWDERDGVFTNLFANGTFYRRRSPTSFYALMAGAASDAQAERMVAGWLTNGSRFCVNPSFPDGSSDDCYWGLPSISADDPAFPPLGYWRGYVWGPMAQLTYWSLQAYDHLDSVNVARKALCNQMTQMFLNMWDKKGHVCENFSPHKDADECTGDHFYHWGALAGMISLIEEGYY